MTFAIKLCSSNRRLTHVYNADAVCSKLQVFKALKYMHSAELLHRDIKVSFQARSLDPPEFKAIVCIRVAEKSATNDK